MFHKIHYLCGILKLYKHRIMIKITLLNILFIFTLSAVAFAEGDGVSDDLGKDKPKGYSTFIKSEKQISSFSLRSGLYFKGENVINSEPTVYTNKYFDFNNVTTQKESLNNIPVSKKNAILSKITFNPNELLRNYSGK